MTNVYCISSSLHLLFAQAVGYREKAKGAVNRLLYWSPDGQTGFSERFRAMLLPGIWDEVTSLQEVESVYGYKSVWPGSGNRLTAVESRRRLVSAERKLTSSARLCSDKGNCRLFVCNPQAHIDRYLCSVGRRLGAEVTLLEEGLSIYFKEWPLGVHPDKVRVRSYLGRIARSAFLSASRLNKRALLPGRFICDPDFVFDSCIVTKPELVAGSNLARSTVSLLEYFTSDFVREQIASVRWGRDVLQAANLRTIEALYLTRPDSEDGFIPQALEIRVVSEVLTELFRLYGSRLAVKVHPRDSMEKLRLIQRLLPQIRFIEEDPLIPAELLLSKLHIKSCFSIWTGSLLYAQQLFGVPSTSLLPTVVKMLSNEGLHVPTYELLQASLTPIFRHSFGWR